MRECAMIYAIYGSCALETRPSLEAGFFMPKFEDSPC